MTLPVNYTDYQIMNVNLHSLSEYDFKVHGNVSTFEPSLDGPFSDDEWICPSCFSDGKDKDRVKEYSKTLAWLGIMDLVHKDTIREGNGPAMMSVWRANMLRFWQRNHYKYLILGHRLLAGKLDLVLIKDTH